MEQESEKPACAGFFVGYAALVLAPKDQHTQRVVSQ
jgi:hypothetical protein